MFCKISILVFLALFQLGLNEVNLNAGYSTLDDACLVESGISQYEFMQRIVDLNIRLLTNVNIANYLLCVGRKVGYIHADGSINPEFIGNHIGPGMTSETIRALDKCSEGRRDTAGQTLTKNYICVFELIVKSLIDNLKGDVHGCR